MKKSPALKAVGMASWLVTALAAVNVGACALFNFNALHHPMLAGLAGPLHYLVGFAGVVSLVWFCMALACKCKGACKC